MNDLRKLIEHIDRGGKTVRELDPRTGRIVTKPVIEGEIGRKVGSAIGGVFGDKAAKFGGDMGDKAGDLLDKLNPFSSDKPTDTSTSTPAPKSNKNGPSNISDFPSGANSSGRNADGSFNSDSPFVKQMDAKVAATRNPNGNGGHDGSNIDPNDDPEDPKTWPPGIKAAPDFGYLDAEGMWIPTPWSYRTEDGDWKTIRNSPANLIGIPHNKYTPFQLKLEKMKSKVAFVSSSAIEQSKSVKLPGGAPQIPGYKQIDPNKFNTDASGPGINKNLDWVYAYQNGKNFILICPDLFYNTKISIGRHYPSWTNGGIRSDDDRVPSTNGTVFVAAQNFNVNDMILSVVVHSSIGAGNMGPKILKSIQGSLKSV
jgi:hypothetical protein